MNVKKISTPDPDLVRSLVDLHIAAFPDFFLSSLGEGFLSVLYSNYLSSPNCACLVAFDTDGQGKKPIGSAVAIGNPSLFYKELLKKQWLKFSIRAIPSLLKKPGLVARKLVSAIFYRGDASSEFNTANAVLLSTISVSPEAQGQGVGKKLLENVESFANESRFDFVYLMTDQDENSAVNSFYLNNGYRLESTVLKGGGRHMNRYMKQLGVQHV
ncbi:GNAT family N-acetyltransferase [Pseudomonas sp. TH41]|uniref:GNAT family N-acetyltransferase n=1 Tax=Pseudomonas sp. TH41 TaxID=2796405 RepID=UPI001911E309|nr:GNAT family N-acetyltransferase [Pseudomonas sp. TH41]MBK5355072.1 GNAT family N-acetyltransferase [Pseudomonas sp. TH41]